MLGLSSGRSAARCPHKYAQFLCMKSFNEFRAYNNQERTAMPIVKRFLKRSEATIIIGCVLLFVIFSIVDNKGWFSFFTIRNITRFTAILGFMAIGETLLILVREIDLSVGSVYGLVAIAFISFEPTFGIYLSFVVALLIAAAVGLLNSLLV